MATWRFRRIALTIVVAAVMVAAPIAAPDRTPKLIVVLMVDQFRADYVDRFQQQWSHGLKRLATDGAWFRRAEYPYANTVTCAGHSSVASGTVPATHGMILNTWWDRTTRSHVACTDDPNAHNIGYGKPGAGADSLVRLQTTTLADELRSQS